MLVALAVGGRGAPDDIRHGDFARDQICVEKDSPVAHAAAVAMLRAPEAQRVAAEGIAAISSSTASRRSRSGRGARASTFCARCAVRRVQEGTSEFIEGVVESSADLLSTFSHCPELGRSGSVHGKGAHPVEVDAERLADELAPRAVLPPAGLVDLAEHLTGQGNGGGRPAHGVDSFWSHNVIQDHTEALTVASRSAWIHGEGLAIDDPDLEPIWAAADEADLPIMYHAPVNPRCR